MTQFINPTQPLGLPEGSVRALLALAVIGAFIAGVVDQLEIITLVLGFYFGSRSTAFGVDA
jgi:hypothetical protein